jgi:hypothetical protein
MIVASQGIIAVANKSFVISGTFRYVAPGLRVAETRGQHEE